MDRHEDHNVPSAQKFNSQMELSAGWDGFMPFQKLCCEYNRSWRGWILNSRRRFHFSAPITFKLPTHRNTVNMLLLKSLFKLRCSSQNRISGSFCLAPRNIRGYCSVENRILHAITFNEKSTILRLIYIIFIVKPTTRLPVVGFFSSVAGLWWTKTKQRWKVQ